METTPLQRRLRAVGTEFPWDAVNKTERRRRRVLRSVERARRKGNCGPQRPSAFGNHQMSLSATASEASVWRLILHAGIGDPDSRDRWTRMRHPEGRLLGLKGLGRRSAAALP
jgi:hypothetical protein